MSYPRARIENGAFILEPGKNYFVEGSPSTLKAFQTRHGLKLESVASDEERDWSIMVLSSALPKTIASQEAMGLIPRLAGSAKANFLFLEQYGGIEPVTFWERAVEYAAPVVDTAVNVGEPVRDVAKAVTDIGDSLFKGALAIGAAWGLFKLLSKGKK